MSQIKVLFRNWVNLKGCSPEEFERIKKYAMKSTQADVLKLYRNTLTDIRFNAEVGIRKGVFNELQSIKNYYRSHGIIGKDFKEYAGLSSMLRRMGKISFRKDLDNLLKLIKDNNWSDEIVETIRNEYLLTKDDFNDILRDYIDKNFGWDYSEYREKFRFFANFSISYLKHYKIPVTIIATKTDKIGITLQQKQRNAILNDLDLVVGDDFIMFSNVTKAGKEEVLKKIEITS